MFFLLGTAIASILAFPVCLSRACKSVDGQFVHAGPGDGVRDDSLRVQPESHYPRRALFGFAFTVNFLGAIAPLNPMRL